MPRTVLYDKVSQLLFPRLGSNMNPVITVEEDADRIESLLERCPIGGLVLFNGSRYRTPQTLARLQAASPYPLLVATDMERGLGQQLTGATIFPHALAFDTLGDEADEMIAVCARAAAREAIAAGVHITFSPVADVHSNPANPIISTRAFGRTPSDVADRVAAYIEGCHTEGLLTTAKHFPGHGDTDCDSHETIPVVERSRSGLEEIELPPFRRAVEEGVDLIMTAHVSYPALDGSGRIATESSAILIDLLRHELGFDGAVISDSLLMKGVDSTRFTEGERAANLINAGVDILLDIADPERVADYLVTAVRGGGISEDRIDEAFDRVCALKRTLSTRFGTSFFIDPSDAMPLSIIGCDEHRATAREVASRAIRVVTGSLDGVRLTTQGIGSKGFLVLYIRPHSTYNDPTASSFESAVQRAFSTVRFEDIGPDTPQGVLDGLLDVAATFEGILVAAAVIPAAWHRVGLLPEQKAFVQSLTESCPVIVGALGCEEMLLDFPDAALGFCTYSDVEDSQRALLDRIQSLIRTPGPFPSVNFR